MKVYVQDNGVYGVCIAISDSEENARKALAGCYNYEADEPLEVYPLEGFVYENLGDR